MNAMLVSTISSNPNLWAAIRTAGLSIPFITQSGLLRQRSSQEREEGEEDDEEEERNGGAGCMSSPPPPAPPPPPPPPPPARARRAVFITAHISALHVRRKKRRGWLWGAPHFNLHFIPNNTSVRDPDEPEMSTRRGSRARSSSDEAAAAGESSSTDGGGGATTAAGRRAAAATTTAAAQPGQDSAAASATATPTATPLAATVDSDPSPAPFDGSKLEQFLAWCARNGVSVGKARLHRASEADSGARGVVAAEDIAAEEVHRVGRARWGGIWSRHSPPRTAYSI